MSELLIIGGGPTGLSAAIIAASAGVTTTIVEKGKPGGRVTGSAKIENYLGFPRGIRGDVFAAKGVVQAKKFGVKFVTGEVQHIGRDEVGHMVTLACGTVMVSSSILLAMGMSLRELDIPGNNKWGVCLGMNPGEMHLFKGKRVGVIGGADAAGQAAVGLSKVAHSVKLFHRNEMGMSSYLRGQIDKRRNIEAVHSFPRRIHGRNRVSGVECGDGSHHSLEALFLFIGAHPKTEWVEVEKDKDGFIRTQGFATSVEGVFAAGDIRAGSYKRVSVAVGEGAAAAVEIQKYLAQRASIQKERVA